jgi:transaldolase
LQNATSKGELGDLEGPDRFEGLTTNPSLAYRAVPQKEFYIGLC